MKIFEQLVEQSMRNIVNIDIMVNPVRVLSRMQAIFIICKMQGKTKQNKGPRTRLSLTWRTF